MDSPTLFNSAHRAITLSVSLFSRVAHLQAGAGVGADFDYMQKAETARLDEAAAISCMEKLLGEFEPCQFLPLLLQAACEDHNSPAIQVR